MKRGSAATLLARLLARLATLAGLVLRSTPAEAGEVPAPVLSRATIEGAVEGPDPVGEDRIDAAAKSTGLDSLTAVQPRTRILTFAEVLDSLGAHDPRLVAARTRVDAAEGRRLAARGGFDGRLALRGLVQPLSYYEYGVVDVRYEQPTPLWGLGVWTGWRLGLGEFPIYEGKLQTAEAGELRVGATLPLWQGGPIDRRRANIRQAELGLERADLELDAAQLRLQAAAAEAYWNWVAAGLALEIERSLLDIARERDAGLRRQIELGALEAIVGKDNRRVVLAREARVVGAEREFQAAALELSLFLRDATGEPLVAGADRLPLRMPEPAPPGVVDVDAEIEAALARRPDLAAATQTRAQAQVEVRVAKNLRSPSIDVSAWAAKDIGRGPADLLPAEFAAAIEIEIPIPLREARGRLQTARAELSRLDAELRFASDRVALEVRDAHFAVTAAFSRAQLAGEQVELARELAEAELRRFTLGAGDLLLVNLRELATATAAREQVEALAAYFVATAELHVALGLSVQSAYDSPQK
ncbi:MAG: TolC family protein [Enhygromyxa sp.]